LIGKLEGGKDWEILELGNWEIGGREGLGNWEIGGREGLGNFGIGKSGNWRERRIGKLKESERQNYFDLFDLAVLLAAVKMAVSSRDSANKGATILSCAFCVSITMSSQ